MNQQQQRFGGTQTATIRDSSFFRINSRLNFSMERADDRLMPEENLSSSSKRERTSNNRDGSGKRRGGSSSRRSESIPLPSSHVHRTHSEVQLCEDMESAELRDLNMFYRLVNGIRDRQMSLAADHSGNNNSSSLLPLERHYHHQYHHPVAASQVEAETCLAHIIRTRNAPLDVGIPSTHPRHDDPSRQTHNALLPPPLLVHNLNATGSLQRVLDQFQGGLGINENLPGDWSIDGFEATAVPINHNMNQEEEEEEGIFHLDL